jgi:hypothetical protein
MTTVTFIEWVSASTEEMSKSVTANKGEEMGE